MTTLNSLVDFVPSEPWARHPGMTPFPRGEHRNGHAQAAPVRDADFLRACAWEIGERKPADSFTPAAGHVGLAMVTPYQGYAHWRILADWVNQTAGHKGEAWHHCRMVLRLYDVSYVVFNGLNANQVHDYPLPNLTGQLFFKLPRPGTWQLAEVGFVLRSGEFIPAGRSQVVRFGPDAGSSRGDHAALLVDERGRVEEVGNVWEQERILRERREPRLRKPLRIGLFALGASAAGHEGASARFVSELAAGQCAAGHEVHVFIPVSDRVGTPREIDGVRYHPLEVALDGTPLEQADRFAEAAEEHLRDLPPFDLVHLHEWMTGRVSRAGACPTVLSLSSIEATRRNGATPDELSLAIEQAERELAGSVDCILTPDWLRDKAAAELGINGAAVRGFPMEGRLPNEWEGPLDYGRVKMGIGFGPLDRLLVFVGPLEHAAGPDLLLEALPVLLQRSHNVRVAFAGAGNLHHHLEHRARHLGVAHAVRLLGHVDGGHVRQLVRSAEALVLPARYRVPFDDAVVDLARRAGRPVVTTHGGPAHLVRHEETGIITYDNPGSIVWAMDRILGDPGHAERMGAAGRRSDGCQVRWSDVARHYLEFCAASFPELTETL